MGNVVDGHMDLAVVLTQLTRHRGFLLPSAKGVGAYGHRGFLLSTKGVGDRNVSTSNGAAAARKVLNAFFYSVMIGFER